jgi:choline dehydrogenase
MIAIRPPREDYDDWGLAGWSWEDVLPSFRLLETDADFGAASYHGDSGPIPVFRMPRDAWGGVDHALAGSALAAGFGWADDLNAPGATGVSPYPINCRDLRRVSTYDGYLEPARGRDTLAIRGGALVDRVLFDGSRAVGVVLASTEVAYADEVVLSAGAVHTPAILQRSGIGPADLLRELGVAVVADLAAGEGLQDHAMINAGLLLRSHARVRTQDDRFTNCCVRFSSGDPEGSANDLMLVSLNVFDATGAGWPFQRVPGLDAAAPLAAGAIGVWLNAPASRGHVRIASRDPRAQPLVQERMLSEDGDRRRLRRAARLLAELVSAPSVAEICERPPSDTNPELWAALDDDERLDAHLRRVVVDTMHATSTCAIGSIVDEQLRVLGVERLRVADASVFPSCPRANTNLATIAVGETAVQWL